MKNLLLLKYLPKFFTDDEVSMFTKLEAFAYILLIVSPLDLLPSIFAGGLGIIDDTIIFVIFFNRIMGLLNKYIEPRSSSESKTTDVYEADYEIIDDDDN